MRNATLTTLCGALLALSAAPAAAVPAEIVILLDTSASMAETLPGTEVTKLERAKEIARTIATTAGEAGHRVGLFRFRQLETRVHTGQGERRVTIEDTEDQCVLAADLLAPVVAGGQHAVIRWLDGVDGPVDPEVQALGDSPLFRSTRLALGFIRARRAAAPLQSCVNAHLVVITDGEDTCAAGAELANAESELRAQSVAEDIRGLVVAVDPTTDAAQILAGLGHESDADVRPFGFDELAEADARVALIQGRPAFEACLVSGVPADKLPAGLSAPEAEAPAAGEGPGEPTTAGGGGGCSGAAGGAPLAVVLILLGVLLLWRSRRLGALALAALIGLSACGDSDTTPVEDTPDAVGDVTVDVPELPEDPSLQAERALARQSALIDAIPAVRAELLDPILDPETVFEAIDGDPREGCAALARSMAFEPTRQSELGAAGCLAVRRCNAIDRALLAQACLAHHGVTSELQRCTASPELRETLRALAHEPRVEPDIAPIEARLEAIAAEALTDEPELAGALDALRGELDGMMDEALTELVAATSSRLAELDPSDATDAASWVVSHVESELTDYVFVDIAGEPLDVLLGEIPQGCGGGALDVATRSEEVEVEIVLQYADLTDFSLGLQPPVSAGAFTYLPAEHFGERLAITLTDASQAQTDDDIPPPATSGCLVAHFEIGGAHETTAPFFLLGEHALDCPDAPAAEAQPGRQLARVILRTSVRNGSGWSTLERVLVDRYGYALSLDGAHASGPQYSTEALKTLAPMRVDLLVGAGLPTHAWLLDRWLADLEARRDELARQLAQRYGVIDDPGAPALPVLRRPYDTQTLALVAWQLPKHLPEGAALSFSWSWRLATVRKRGFGEVEGGLSLVPQQIFDIVDLPAMVLPPVDGSVSDETRLAANRAIGALATEAELLTAMAFDTSPVVINAAAMLRTDGTGPWALYDSDEAHDATRFPLAVQDAAKNRAKNFETLVSTPGAAPFAGSSYVAWWRFNRAGMSLGEIRFDGTFYGGAASAAKAVGTLDYCLAAQAVAALTSAERVVPDVECCLALAAEVALWGMALDWAQGIAGWTQGFYIGGVSMGNHILDVFDTLGLFVSIFDMASGIVTKPPVCEDL